MAGGRRDLVDALTAALRRTWKSALDALFPDFCGGCGREGAIACASCWGSIPLHTDPQPFQALAVWSVTDYRSPTVRGVVHALKYGRRPEARALVAEALGRWAPLGPLAATRWTLVPMPMHAARLRRRGTNQAEALASALAARGFGAVRLALVRARRTASQTRLDRAARQRNVQGAFRAAARLDPVAAYLLVDDVVTTGATLAAAAEALRAAGARRISAWTFAAD